MVNATAAALELGQAFVDTLKMIIIFLRFRTAANVLAYVRICNLGRNLCLEVVGVVVWQLMQIQVIGVAHWTDLLDIYRIFVVRCIFVLCGAGYLRNTRLNLIQTVDVRNHLWI